MKKLILLFSFLTSSYFSIAQTKVDQERLLEYYQAQRYSEAAQYLEAVYDKNTDNAKELAQLAYTNLMANKLAEAEKNYLKLYEKQPTNLPILFTLASINSRRGNDVAAKKYYLEILKTDSTNFNAHKLLADLSKGEFNKEKLEHLIKANQINPADPDVAFDLCELFFKVGEFGRANRVLAPALNADSTNLRLLKMKMPISMASKNYEESIQTGKKLLSYGDSSTFVLNNLGKSYFLSLDYQNALKYFLIIKDQSIDNEGLSYNIGLSYRGIKDYKNAIPYFETAIKDGISTKIATYYGLLGDSFESVNQNEQANSSYKKGLQFENNGSLLYNIALVYETKLNDRKNAISYYEQYLKSIDADKQPKLNIFIKNKIAELKK